MRMKGRARRRYHIRRKLKGTPERLRLYVYRSLKHIYGSIVDDYNNKTICTVSTLSADIKKLKFKNNIEKAKAVGQLLARLAKEKNIEKVMFDRSGYKYHGQVKGIAEGAREGGLKF